MTTTKQYDFLNRLQSVSSSPSAASPISFGYLYNDANQRMRVTLNDGSFWLYDYDKLGQVTSGKKYWPDGLPVPGQQFEYGFDDIGNRTSTKAGGDAAGANLRSATYTATPTNTYSSRTVPGGFDVVGLANFQASVTVNSSPADYRRGEYFQELVNVSNGSTPVWQQINVSALNGGSSNNWPAGYVYVPPTPEAFTYDQDGNLTSDGRWTNKWDGENRLIEMLSLTNTPASSKFWLRFTYDSQGRRISKQASIWTNSAWSVVVSNRFLYDGWNLAAELNATNNAVIRRYQWGLDLSGSEQGAGGVGGLLSISYLPTSSSCFVAYDGNGNMVGLVDATTGTGTATDEYGPFAEPIRLSGAMAKANPFRFSTKYQDDETDFLYYGYRYYNFSTGRWLSRDPILENGGDNVYGMVANHPLNYYDPLGLKWYIDRDSRYSRAWAQMNSQNDTVADLAKDIRLDIADYDKWLDPPDGTPVPCTRYSIPNRVYVNRLVSAWHVWWWQWKRTEVAILRKQGFDVVDTFGTDVTAFQMEFGDKDVHGIVTLAHADEKRAGDFSDNDGYGLAPTEITPHHKLGGFKAIWCFSGAKAGQWQALVSPIGVFFSDPGYIYWWQSYPGGIAHGF